MTSRHRIQIILLLLIGGLIALGIFDFMKKQKDNAVIYRLTWFELQVTPFTYRFAIIPEQPILIGLEGKNGEKGATMLIRYDHVPEVYERTVEKVDALVKKHRILSVMPQNPDLAFSDKHMDAAAVHIRIAYADNKRWAGVFDLDKTPREIAELIKDTKALAKQIMREQSNNKISADKAQEYLRQEKNAAQKESPRVVVKIKVHRSGGISANDREVTIEQLSHILDDVQAQNGEVWYFRESPDKEPSESTVATIKKVLDEVTSRDLPIKLQTDEY